MQLSPYLHFDGRAEEAALFYQKAIDAEIHTMLRMGNSPEPHAPGTLPSGAEAKVMHMVLKIGEHRLLGTDGRCGMNPNFDGFTLTLTVADAAEAKRRFEGLASHGGVVQYPLRTNEGGMTFGTLVDRFGISWMVTTPP